MPQSITVRVVVTDLQWDGSSWLANGSWRREYSGTALTYRGAIRKALASAKAKHGNLKPNQWAQTFGSWKIPRAAIGAYLERETDYAET